MTTEQLAYLRAEHVRLRKQFCTLRSEFEALRRGHVSPQEWAATFQRLLEYRHLLVSHRIALEWMLLKTLFSAPSQPPCAFAVAQEEEAGVRPAC
jgi:hypothetical protein